MATASADWSEILTAVALEVLGEPEERRGNEWCYGRHGSLVVNVGGWSTPRTLVPTTHTKPGYSVDPG